MKRGGPLKRKTELKPATIRALRPGESVPPGVPRRYPNDNGYIRLRWKVGVRRYVEAYEHRVVDGFVTTAEHVHHINRRRDDNRSENLAYLTAEQHHAEHGRDPQRLELMREMYEGGLSTIQIGEKFGHAPGVISKCLHSIHVQARTKSDYANPVDSERLAEQYEAGRSLRSLAVEYRATRARVVQILKDNGVKIRQPGRPRDHPTMEENRVRLAVRARSGGTCEVCGSAKATNYQHRKNRSQGGAYTVPGGLDVCGNGNVDGCHGRIHQHPSEAYSMGWSVKQAYDPADVPVWLPNGTWPAWFVLLSDGGVRSPSPSELEAARKRYGLASPIEDGQQ